MITPLTFLAIAALVKIANLRLVDSFGHTKILFAVSKITILVGTAPLQERPAQLCLMQIWSMAELFLGMCIFAVG